MHCLLIGLQPAHYLKNCHHAIVEVKESLNYNV